MKTRNRLILIGCGMLCICPIHGWNARVFAGVEVKGETAATPKLVVYADGSATPYIPSGWMGNHAAISLDEKCAVQPHSGSTCVKLQYKANDNWGGIVWQDPPNDWGDKSGGYDLSGARQLTFWARGEEGGEKVDFLYGGIKRDKPYFDTANDKISVELTKEWKKYSINLAGKDLTRIKTGFGWSLAGQGKPVTFYLDDIQYE